MNHIRDETEGGVLTIKRKRCLTQRKMICDCKFLFSSAVNQFQLYSFNVNQHSTTAWKQNLRHTEIRRHYTPPCQHCSSARVDSPSRPWRHSGCRWCRLPVDSWVVPRCVPPPAHTPVVWQSPGTPCTVVTGTTSFSTSPHLALTYLCFTYAQRMVAKTTPKLS